MSSSSKTGIETAAAKSLDAIEDCFEVDDITAFDPIAKLGESAAKPASKAAMKGSATEIELSADDVDAMLGDDVISVEVS